MNTVLIEELTWKDIEDYLLRDDLILLPVGSIEQHGPHLPLGTDSIDVQFVAVKAAERCNVLVAPILKYGISQHHMDFAGTISLTPDTLIQTIVEVCRCLAHHGFRKILLINGHGGNNASLDVSIIKMKNDLKDVIIGQVFLMSLHDGIKNLLEDKYRYHADETETSMMLATAPHLVKRERAIEEVPRSPSRLFMFDASQVFHQKTLFGAPRTKAVTDSGIFGDARLGTLDKGTRLIEAQVEGLAAEIEKLRAVNLKDYTEGFSKIF
jgi:creatinine amidohydrolase